MADHVLNGMARLGLVTANGRHHNGGSPRDLPWFNLREGAIAELGGSGDHRRDNVIAKLDRATACLSRAGQGAATATPVGAGTSPEPRTFKATGTTTVCTAREGSAMRAHSSSTAVRPIAAVSCATTVRAGCNRSASGTSSNPTIANREAAWAPNRRRTAMVVSGLPVTSAVAGSVPPSTV